MSKLCAGLLVFVWLFSGGLAANAGENQSASAIAVQSPPSDGAPWDPVALELRRAELQSPSPEGFQLPDEIALSCLTEEEVSWARKYQRLDYIWSVCKDELKASLGADFGSVDEGGLRAILATVIAAQFAEYGKSDAISFNDIARSDYLNCGSLIFLVDYLFGNSADDDLYSFGIHSDILWGHAQLFYNSLQGPLLLDPTTGMVALTSFDDLFRGIPVPSSRIKLFKIKAKTVQWFRFKVYKVVLAGAYRPSHFMYMHSSAQEQITRGASSYYFTPGGIMLRRFSGEVLK